MAFITLHYRHSPKKRADLASSSSAASTPTSSRPRRAGTYNNSAATVQRGLGSADERRQSLKLTVKAPPSKLREVMRANEVDSLHDTLGGGKVLDGPRSTRRTAIASRASGRGAQRPTYAEFGESDLEDDEEEEEDDDDEEEEEEEEELNDFDQLGAEPEGGTDDEDVEMEDATPPPKRHAPPKPPKITLKPPAKTDGKQVAKPKLVVTPANVGPLKSVEDQEMEDDPDDQDDQDEQEVENSSELSDEDEEPTRNLNEEEIEVDEEEIVVEAEDAAPGEDEELEEEDEDDEDDLDDSDDETPGSGTATPDISRMTKRQRGRPEDQGGLMALDMAPQQRKVSLLLPASVA